MIKMAKEAMALWGHQGYEEAADSAYDTIRDYTKKQQNKTSVSVSKLFAYT